MSDEFLTGLCDALRDTPAQRKFRRLRPMPVGCVLIQSPDMGWDDLRAHLRLMKQLGFTCLKQFLLLPGWDERRFMHMALDEGIIPWWYDDAGWEDISDALLDRLGIPRDTPIEALRMHPAWLAHQERVLRARIDRPAQPPLPNEREPARTQRAGRSRSRMSFPPPTHASIPGLFPNSSPGCNANMAVWMR